MENKLLEFECSGIDEQGKFCLEYTGYGKNISPEFVIKNLSPGAKTLAITLEDLSHPIKAFTHWVIWNIPAMNTIREKNRIIRKSKAGTCLWLASICRTETAERKESFI